MFSVNMLLTSMRLTRRVFCLGDTDHNQHDTSSATANPNQSIDLA